MYALAHQRASKAIPIININDPQHQHFLRLELEAQRDPNKFKQFDERTQEQLTARYAIHAAHVAAQKEEKDILSNIISIGISAASPFSKHNSIKSAASLTSSILKGRNLSNFEGLSPEEVEYFPQVSPKFFLDPKNATLNLRAQQFVLNKLINDSGCSTADLAKEFLLVKKPSATTANKKSPAGYAKTQLDNFKELPTKTKQFAQDVKRIKSMTDSKEKNQQLKIAFNQFADYAMPLANFASGLGQISGSSDLQKFGIGVGNAIQIGEMLTSCMAGMINPVFAVTGIASCLMNLAGLFGNDDESNDPIMEGIQQVISTLHAMWSEFRYEFKLLHAEIHMLMNMVCSLGNRMDAQHQIMLASLDNLSGGINDAKQVLQSELRDIHLEPLQQVCTQIQLILNNNKSVDLKNLQKIRDDLFHWIQFDGGLSRGLQTGASEKSIDVKNTDEFNKVNNVIKDPTKVDNLLGFLARTAEMLLPSAKWSSLNKTVLPSLEHWCALTRLYILIHNHFFSQLRGDNNFQLQQIAKTGENILQFMELIQTTPEFFATLFKGYQDALIEIQNIIKDAITSENAKITEDIEKVYPTAKDSKEEKICVDISQDVTTIINGFKGKMPLTTPVSVKLFNDSKEKQHSYDSVKVEERVEINSKIDAELITLAYLGLGKFRMENDVVSNPNFDFRIYFTFNGDKQEHYIVHVDFMSSLCGREWDWRSPHEMWRYKSIWRRGAGVENPRHPSTLNIPVLQTKAKSKLAEYLQLHRKAVKETYILDKRWKPALNKVDSYLKLLKAYAHLAGFQSNELQLLSRLCDSQQIEKQMDVYIADEKLLMSSPHKNFGFMRNFSEFEFVKEVILSKIKNPDGDYFQNEDAHKVKLMLVGLGLLARNNVLKPAKVLLKEPLNELSDKYSKLINTLWKKLWVPKWFDKLSEEAKQSDAYKSCQSNIDSAETNLCALRKMLENPTATSAEIIKVFIILKDFCIAIHCSFKSLNLYVESGEKYTITDKEINFLYDENLHSEDKMLEQAQLQRNVTSDAKSAAVLTQQSTTAASNVNASALCTLSFLNTLPVSAAGVVNQTGGQSQQISADTKHIGI